MVISLSLISLKAGIYNALNFHIRNVLNESDVQQGVKLTSSMQLILHIRLKQLCHAARSVNVLH